MMPFRDLKAQYQALKLKIDHKAMQTVLDEKDQVIMGRQVKRTGRNPGLEYVGAKSTASPVPMALMPYLWY